MCLTITLSLGNNNVVRGDKEKIEIYRTVIISSSLFMNPAQILKYLKNVSLNFPGYDEISPKLILKVCRETVVPLSHIINQSASRGIYSDHLKIAKITPVCKPGNIDDVIDSRPVSFLPAFNIF